MMNNIIVLQGPPCGGKSTLARKLHEEDKSKVIICRDSIRESRGDYWIPEQEDWISSIEYYMVETALKKNLTPIIDATNLNPKTINKWEELASSYNIKCEYIECVVDYKEALLRDKKRGDKVGEKVIKNFYEKYYPNLIYKSSYTDIDFDDSKSKAIICDLDGTLALRGKEDNARLPFDYERVGEDYCDPRLAHLLKTIITETEYEIFFITGRENTGLCYEKTCKWISDNIHPECWDNFGGEVPEYNWKLYMREKDDKRSDEEVKKEIYEKYIKPWFSVVMVFEDRNKVVDMWRNEGLLCSQVREGDF